MPAAALAVRISPSGLVTFSYGSSYDWTGVVVVVHVRVMESTQSREAASVNARGNESWPPEIII